MYLLETVSSLSPYKQLADERLAQLNLSDCQLAVYCSLEKISWSILDTIHHKVVSLVDYKLEKQPSSADWWNASMRIIEENGLGQKKFGKVKIGVDTGKNMLVPQELFVESEMNAYLGFGFSLPEQPARDFIPGIPAYNLYCLPDTLLESLKKVFEKPVTFHASTSFITNILRENKNLRENKIFACLTGNILHAAALESGKIVFYNNFLAKTKEDFAYFLMAVTEELSQNPEQVSIALSGEIIPDSPHYETSKRFLKNLSFSERPKALKYSPVLDNVPHHVHSLLYGIHLCES